MKIISLKKTASTQDYIKKLIKKQCAAREDVIVVAEVQKKGRGTKNRSFESNKGGVYLSYLKFHHGLLAKNCFCLVKQFSIAAVKTLKAFGIISGIKWPNDIYCEGKKICGMLIENSFSGDYADYTILGIGLNVNNDLSADLKDIATSMKQILLKEVDLKTVIATLIYNLLNPEDIDLYARYSIVLGKQIKVIKKDGEEFFDVAEQILSDGRLKLASGKILCAEEVSVRL